MATKLKSFDWSKQSNLTTTPKADYPWDPVDENGEPGWFDGDIWKIEEDEDFEGPPLMMERIVRTRATGRRVKVKLRHIPPSNGRYRFTVTVPADSVEEAEKALTKKLGKGGMTYKPSPFGTIVLQRTDIVGPLQAKAEERKAKAAATRAAKTVPAPALNKLNKAKKAKAVSKKTVSKKTSPLPKLQAV